MKRFIILFVLLSSMSKADVTNFPQLEITNGLIKANLYLPDPESGFYRETRFDWSGVISNLEYKNHTYFGRWYNENNPPPTATIMGPVEAYSPLNFNEATPGEHFVKIGVGAIKKPSSEKYSPFNTYTIVNPGKWDITSKKNEVKFTHTLNTESYSYEYTKTVTLMTNEPKMLISHSLKNTGKKRIKTKGFNHNFFVIDNQPVGQGFDISFPVNVSGDGRGVGDYLTIEGKKIVFSRNLKKDESFAIKFLNGLNTIEDFNIRINQFDTGAGVKITGDHLLPRLMLWGTMKTICPETYIHLDVGPREEFKWTYYYEFYELEAKIN